MSTAGCTGPQCTFTGSRSVSNAAKGRCIGTSGYISNAEINEIKAKGNFKSFQDSTHSSILVYNDMEWVAYMDDTVKAQRESMYDLWNFAGTTDWAVDLQKFLPFGGNDNGGDDGGGDDEEQYEEDGWDGDQIEKEASKIPPHCIAKYLAEVGSYILGQALNSYDKFMQNGYDKSQIPFQIYKYMAGAQKTGFFSCTERKWVLCCISCSSACGTKENPCVNDANCKNGYQNIIVDCPTMLSNGGWETKNNTPSVTYTLTNENGFYKDIAEKYGIEKSWIKWGRRRAFAHTGCGRAEDIKAC